MHITTVATVANIKYKACMFGNEVNSYTELLANSKYTAMASSYSIIMINIIPLGTCRGLRYA